MESRGASVQSVVLRPRLFERLDEGVAGPVTLVTAPAGSGKTLLVSSWLANTALAGPAVHVTVERAERDAMRFWTGVLERIGDWPATAGAGALSGLTAAPSGGGELFAGRLAAALADLAAPVVLVIDDVHHLESADALAGLASMIAHCPPQLRMVLVARGAPRVGLYRVRLTGALTEIGAADLAFTADELDELLDSAGIELSAGGRARLLDRTEGWAAGLRLAAMSLVDNPDPERFIAQFSGSERTVADYLLGEVLDGQPPAVHRLLLRTCILERTSGPLADALSGGSDGQRVLRELEDAHAFVESVDAGRRWFRYHPLLAD